jgi:hypothetical protein
MLTTAAVAALAVVIYLWWGKKSSDDGLLGDLDPGTLPDTLGDLVKSKVTLRCLWCRHDAFTVERDGLIVGERDEWKPCETCGRHVRFVSTTSEGRWCIS